MHRSVVLEGTRCAEDANAVFRRTPALICNSGIWTSWVRFAGLRATMSRTNAVTLSLVAMQLLAFFPIWRWYATRIVDPSDEPWGLLALATAILFFSRKGNSIYFKSDHLLVPALLMLAYAGTYSLAPRLLQAALAMAAIGCAWSSFRLGTPVHAPSLGLLMLSLPVMPSLQFYLGYPLRVISGILAATTLNMSGLTVVREGACLRWGTELISIDAPCSGLRMMWAALYIAVTLACFQGLSTARTVALVAAAFVSITLGNAIRSASLFHLETQFPFMPNWCHDAVGVVVFSAVALATVRFCRVLGGETRCGT